MMFGNPLARKPMQQIKPQREKSEDCKIKIKNSPDGTREIRFSGNCSKSQIDIAKDSLGTDRVSRDDE